MSRKSRPRNETANEQFKKGSLKSISALEANSGRTKSIRVNETRENNSSDFGWEKSNCGEELFACEHDPEPVQTSRQKRFYCDAEAGQQNLCPVLADDWHVSSEVGLGVTEGKSCVFRKRRNWRSTFTFPRTKETS